MREKTRETAVFQMFRSNRNKFRKKQSDSEATRACRLEPARHCGGFAPEWAFCFAKYSPTFPLRTPLDSIEQVFPTDFDNQQIKFEQSKRLSGETPLNASLYKKGATIVAPRYHSSRTEFGRQGLRLCVQAPACPCKKGFHFFKKSSLFGLIWN